jgi:hypothetical protein
MKLQWFPIAAATAAVAVVCVSAGFKNSQTLSFEDGLVVDGYVLSAAPEIPEGQNPWDNGNPDASAAKMKQTMALMSANNGSPRGLPLSAFQIPDGRFEPSAHMRSERGIHFWPPSEDTGPDGDFLRRLYNDAALLCMTYAQVEIDKDDFAKRSIDRSFYLVGWKDGTVERIPRAKTRVVTTPSGNRAVVFPRMQEYSSASERLAPQKG